MRSNIAVMTMALALLSSGSLAGERGVFINPPSGGGGSNDGGTPHIVGRDTVQITMGKDVVEAIGGALDNDADPGPATPKVPGGGIAVSDKPDIVILDDGVGSNGPGQPGGPGTGGKGGADVLVLRLACSFSPDGLTIRNVGGLDAPAGLKLRWQAVGQKVHGTVRLERELKAGRAALLGGVAATGAGCGIAAMS